MPMGFKAVISKNLFVVRLRDARRGPCCREFSGADCAETIKLSNPQFSHPSQRDQEGTLRLTWFVAFVPIFTLAPFNLLLSLPNFRPECFDISVDVTLPPSLSIPPNCSH